jgi:hypothetical protein
MGDVLVEISTSVKLGKYLLGRVLNDGSFESDKSPERPANTNFREEIVAIAREIESLNIADQTRMGLYFKFTCRPWHTINYRSDPSQPLKSFSLYGTPSVDRPNFMHGPSQHVISDQTLPAAITNLFHKLENQ